jgi:hypothetical protein
MLAIKQSPLRYHDIYLYIAVAIVTLFGTFAVLRIGNMIFSQKTNHPQSQTRDFARSAPKPSDNANKNSPTQPGKGQNQQSNGAESGSGQRLVQTGTPATAYQPSAATTTTSASNPPSTVAVGTPLPTTIVQTTPVATPPSQVPPAQQQSSLISLPTNILPSSPLSSLIKL